MGENGELLLGVMKYHGWLNNGLQRSLHATPEPVNVTSYDKRELVGMMKLRALRGARGAG